MLQLSYFSEKITTEDLNTYMITTSFGILFLLAFIMSIEFGQTATEIVRQGTTYGFKNALLISFGAFVSEILFLILTITGLIFFFSDPKILKFVWIFGGVILFYLGIQALRNHKNIIAASDQQEKNDERRPFLTGLAINFLHPLNILWWSGTLGPIILASAHDNGFFTATIDGLGVSFGALAWWVTLSFISSFIQRSFTGSVIKSINMLSSVGLILFGVYFLYKASQLFF